MNFIGTKILYFFIKFPSSFNIRQIIFHFTNSWFMEILVYLYGTIFLFVCLGLVE